MARWCPCDCDCITVVWSDYWHPAPRCEDCRNGDHTYPTYETEFGTAPF